MYQYVSLTKQNVAYVHHTLKLSFFLCRRTQANGVGVISRRSLICWLWTDLVSHWNSSHIYGINTQLQSIVNRTNTAGRFALDYDGNYSFVATNSFGTDLKEFSAIITGKTLL